VSPPTGSSELKESQPLAAGDNNFNRSNSRDLSSMQDQQRDRGGERDLSLSSATDRDGNMSASPPSVYSSSPLLSLSQKLRGEHSTSPVLSREASINSPSLNRRENSLPVQVQLSPRSEKAVKRATSPRHEQRSPRGEKDRERERGDRSERTRTYDRYACCYYSISCHFLF
jgi:hypothetical protein